jgi:hypothetical protein
MFLKYVGGNVVRHENPTFKWTTIFIDVGQSNVLMEK